MGEGGGGCKTVFYWNILALEIFGKGDPSWRETWLTSFFVGFLVGDTDGFDQQCGGSSWETVPGFDHGGC